MSEGDSSRRTYLFPRDMQEGGVHWTGLAMSVGSTFRMDSRVDVEAVPDPGIALCRACRFGGSSD